MIEVKQIHGFFLDFTEEEVEDVKKALDLLGYSPDGTGMKEMLLDALFDTGDEDRENDMERFIGKSRAYIREHPETVKMGISALRSLAGMFAKPRK